MITIIITTTIIIIIWERAAVAAAGALDKVFVHVIDDIHDALELDLTAFEC